jgi:hypothetical protein
MYTSIRGVFATVNLEQRENNGNYVETLREMYKQRRWITYML